MSVLKFRGFAPRWLTPAPDSLLAHSRRRGLPAWTEFVHLLWTMWVFVTPTFSPQGYDARWWLLTAFSYPLFILLYVGTVALPQRKVLPCAAGMVVLCLGLLPWYPSGMSYFVFGCVMLGAYPWRTGWHYAVVLLLANLVLIGFARGIHYPWSALVWIPVTTLVIGLVVNVERQRHKRDAALRLSQDEVRRLAATAERERIGRDLHDLLGHTLSLVALMADLAGRLIERDPGAAQREVAELGQVARQALGQVRRAVTGIRAAGLAAELAAARLLLEAEGVEVHAALEDAALAPEQETALALCLREAATNIQRHARARRVVVSLERLPGGWRLQVDDNGRGGPIRRGNGLDGMRERLQALGGRLRIEPVPAGRGTRLVAELPHWPVPAQAQPADATPAPAG